SATEIAQAAGVPVARVEALVAEGRLHRVSPVHPYFRLDQAVGAVKALRHEPVAYSEFFEPPAFDHTPAQLPVAVSGTFHAAVAAAIVFISTVGFPQASTRNETVEKTDSRLVFL